MKEPLWHPMTKTPPVDKIILVDFGKSATEWPNGIIEVMKTKFMFYEQDEGQWKGMGSAADVRAERWCLLSKAIDRIGDLP
jgi:hypothetical protein